MKDKNLKPDTKKVKYLNCSVEFDTKSITKSADGALIIDGYANTVDKDRVNDVVLPEAFKECLPSYLDNPVLLFQHDWDKVIGKVLSAEIDDRGLKIKAYISQAKDCEDVRTKIREGILKTFSIGYNEIDADLNEATKTNVIKKLELLEISVVTIPANTAATFTPTAVTPEGEGKSGAGAATPAAQSVPGAVSPQRSIDLESVVKALEGNSAVLAEVLKYLGSQNSKGEIMNKPNEQKSPAAATAGTAQVTEKKEGHAPGAAPADAGGAAAPEGGAAAPEGGAAAPEGGAPAAAPEAVDPKKVMEALAALSEMVGKVHAMLEQIVGAKGHEPKEKPEGEAEAADDGKEKPEGEAEAADDGKEKPVDEMCDEDVEEELEAVSAELENLGVSA